MSETPSQTPAFFWAARSASRVSPGAKEFLSHLLPRSFEPELDGDFGPVKALLFDLAEGGAAGKFRNNHYLALGSGSKRRECTRLFVSSFTELDHFATLSSNIFRYGSKND